MTEDKAERLIKARELRLGVLRKKHGDSVEARKADEEKQRMGEEEDLAALQESETRPERKTATVYEEEEEDPGRDEADEDAEEEAAYLEYLASRDAAKGGV